MRGNDVTIEGTKPTAALNFTNSNKKSGTNPKNASRATNCWMSRKEIAVTYSVICYAIYRAIFSISEVDHQSIIAERMNCKIVHSENFTVGFIYFYIESHWNFLEEEKVPTKGE